MKVRPVGIVMQPTEAAEAEGVLIRRTIGSEKLVLLDPFLLLDHLNVEAHAGGETREVGFPRHPHRGIETLTYVFTGNVRHHDSLGNDDTIGALESQWMTAGGGIFHAEMLKAGSAGNEALQIWFNLPAAQKMKPAAYVAANAHDIPETVLEGGAKVRVVAGQINGIHGAFQGIAVNPIYLDVVLPAGASVTLPAPEGESTIAYLCRGNAEFGTEDGRKTTSAPHLVIFGEGDTVQVKASAEADVRFIYVSAKPLYEPVLQYRSLVMNTVEQMRLALNDLEAGTFERKE